MHARDANAERDLIQRGHRARARPAASNAIREKSARSDAPETLPDYAALLRRTGRAAEAAKLEARAASLQASK